MAIKEKMNEDLKRALKSRDAVKVSVLRMLLSQIHNKEIEKRQALTDEDTLKVLSSEKKKHQDSISQFEQGGRQDLVSKERLELGMIESYLPEPLGEEELKKIIREVMESESSSDFGRVMKAVMAKVKGRSDGGLVSRLVKEEIQK